VPAGRTIAVFGSSEPRPGDPLYETARQVGRRLAASGLAVLTGGYGGVMEAASRGARDGGGEAIGITCAIFSAREPNRWLTEVESSPDLHERTRRLVERADGFVVTGGKAGTLAELSFLWALHRAGCLGPRPVVVFNEPWGDLLDRLRQADMLEAAQIGITRRVDTPAQAVRAIRLGLGLAAEDAEDG
jgi:uncharacterized protein (TIGR00730 family)